MENYADQASPELRSDLSGPPKVDGTWTDPSGDILTLVSGQSEGAIGWQISGSTGNGEVSGWTCGNAVALAIFSGTSVGSVIGSFTLEGTMTVATVAQTPGFPAGAPTSGTTVYTRS